MNTILNTEFNSHLVLCIEEHDIINNSIDTRVFITYDQENKTYIVTGKRQAFKDLNPAPYMFRFTRSKYVYMFLNFIIGSRVSVLLYNFDNLSDSLAEYTYDFLEDMMDENYEIVAHDNVKMSEKETNDWLDMLKNTFNFDTEMGIF